MKYLLCIPVLAAGVLFLLLAIRSSRRQAAPGFESQHEAGPASRLMRYIRQKRSYRYFVGLPLQQPNNWCPVSPSGDQVLESEDGQRFQVDSIRAFIVAYSDGEILDCEGEFDPLPVGVAFIQEAAQPTIHFLTSDDFKDGSKYIHISFGEHPERAEYEDHFATWFTNVSPHSIRVTKFAAYVRDGERFQLSTISNTFFTEKHFQNWYGLGQRKWIAPGETVCDPNNYGGGSFLWAYWCQTEAGDSFIVAKLDT